MSHGDRIASLPGGFVNLGISDQSDTNVPFLIGSLLVTLWIFLSGWALVRFAPRVSEPA